MFALINKNLLGVGYEYLEKENKVKESQEKLTNDYLMSKRRGYSIPGVGWVWTETLEETKARLAGDPITNLIVGSNNLSSESDGDGGLILKILIFIAGLLGLALILK